MKIQVIRIEEYTSWHFVNKLTDWPDIKLQSKKAKNRMSQFLSAILEMMTSIFHIWFCSTRANCWIPISILLPSWAKLLMLISSKWCIWACSFHSCKKTVLKYHQFHYQKLKIIQNNRFCQTSNTSTLFLLSEKDIEMRVSMKNSSKKDHDSNPSSTTSL